MGNSTHYEPSNYQDGCDNQSCRTRVGKPLWSYDGWRCRRRVDGGIGEVDQNASRVDEISVRRDVNPTWKGEGRRRKKRDIMKNIVQGTVQGKRQRGTQKINHMNNLNKWTEITNIEITIIQNVWRQRQVANTHKASAATIGNYDADRWRWVEYRRWLSGVEIKGNNAVEYNSRRRPRRTI